MDEANLPDLAFDWRTATRNCCKTKGIDYGINVGSRRTGARHIPDRKDGLIQPGRHAVSAR